MSDHTEFEKNSSRRKYTAPYTSRHPVPTVQGYEARKGEREAEAEATIPDKVEEEVPDNIPTQSKAQSVLDTTKDFFHIDHPSRDKSVNEQQPYNSWNHNIDHDDVHHREASSSWQDTFDGRKAKEGKDQSSGLKDTSEAIESTLDPRQKRKNMKHMKRDHAPREVTDPVTHLPVLIHDSTSKELRTVPENEPPPGSQPRTATGSSAKSKNRGEIEKEIQEEQAQHRGMQKLFPPPDFESAREQIASIYTLAFTLGMGSLLAMSLLLLLGSHLLAKTGSSSRTWLSISISSTLLVLLGLGVGGGIIYGTRGWLENTIHGIWDDEVWNAARKQERETAVSPMPESTQWLNSLLASVWPLVNPDLFTSLADTLEDVMQASLPKLVRMISVEDIGQGSESIRILGVRWLPTGAAAKSVSKDGNIKADKGQEESDRKVPGEGEVADGSKSDGDDEHGPAKYGNEANADETEKDENKEEGDQTNVAEGMEAEEGDFVNIEVAFSYRASSTGKSLALKSKNAHIFLAFYLPGSIRFPVWVELRGIVGTMRMRLQLCPDPPFFALCTLTLLGQPKADLSCIPLTRKGLNIMNLPLISSFVQSSIDAALAEYVAPKSLTLDLKDMLVGDDFKKDTNTRGVVMVKIHQGRDFKAGDPGIVGLKKSSSDGYVAVGWAKFGKPVWSTRVIVDDMQPVWDETTFVLVGPEELNAEERLRIQLWDSDRTTADDDLGRIEVNLKEIMHESQYLGRMCDRTDGFQTLEGSDEMPGTLDWSVGYYPKTKIQPEQFEKQQVKPNIKTIQQLKDIVSKDAERKLHEATDRDESHEVDQQKAQGLKITEDAIIIATPPLVNYPTGIFSIQVHQITGLQFEKMNKSHAEEDEGDETVEGAGELPSSYCTVILNHQTIFRTRTKPKNAEPFFNAGTERLVRDWRSTEIILSVRDTRVHENDALLGIVYLPLGKIFRERSQVMDQYPLEGGIGYGRARISMVFRSIQLQAPKELLGWDYGTLEVNGPIISQDIIPELRNLRIKLRTSVNRGKLYPSNSDDRASHWTGKHDRPIRIAVRKRYCSCLMIEFRKHNLGLDKTPAFAVLWLKDIPDEEQQTVTLPIWRREGDNIKRAESNCVRDVGEEMGHISIPLKFCRGLGAYHQKLASKSPNLQDVFEVVATANDNSEGQSEIGAVDENSHSDSSSDDDSGDGREHHKTTGILQKLSGKMDGDDRDAKSGPVEEIKEYEIHSGQLHRRHRGVMQWKGARTANWIKTKMEHGKDHVMDNFQRHERDPGIETEV